MTRLCELAKKYGTDKVYYTPFYHTLLEHRKVYRVLEIGIGYPECMKHVPNYKAGASLRMWAEYFPQARITGMDVNPNALIQEDRIFSILGNQAKEADLLAAVNFTGMQYIDLIIDDGSHASDHQIETARTLFPYVTPGGLYIIEDVNHFEAVSPFLDMPHACITCHQGGLSRDPILIARFIVIQK